jgi:outer membrane protein assembly factor BamA
MVFLLVLLPLPVEAQQDEIPPVAEDPGGGSSRIVTHRPPLYTLKKVAHPVSWLEGGMFPVLRLAERLGGNFAKKDDENKPPSVSGIKIGAKGLGGSTGFGPQIKPYHNDLFHTGIRVEVPAVVTYKMYQSAGVHLNIPFVSGQGMDLDVFGDYLSRPSDFFTGLGNQTEASNGSRFRTVTRSAGAGLNIRFRPTWLLRLETGMRNVGVTDPRKGPDMQLVFRDSDIPGKMTGGSMNVYGASIQRNTLDDPNWAASGGLQRFEAGLVEGQKGGDYAYWRYRLDVEQALPLSEDRRKVIALRAAVETNRNKGGSTVPFFDMATIGGSSSLRGYQTNRFTDRSAMTVSAEYRYRIWRYFDWGFFVDGGQVAPEIGNFAMDNFHMGYGVRLFARSEKRRGIIVDLARSREAWMVYLDFSPMF